MIKILAIDDEDHIRLLIFEELSDRGYEIYTHDGSNGVLKYVDDIKPDLVILDIKMDHKINEYSKDDLGLYLLQKIREKYIDMPVILFTAYDVFKEDIRSLAATYWVTKSFQINELVEKIEMALEAIGLDFNRLNFGASTAERDISQGLLHYFVETSSFKRVLDGNKTIILGNRGTGKSAIIQMISKRRKKPTDIINYSAASGRSMKRNNTIFYPLTLPLSPGRGN